jgi:phosphoglycerol transferase
MFMTLAWFALTVGPRVRRWVTASAVPRPVVVVLAGAVVLFGLADQSSAVPDPTFYVDTFVSDKAFFATIEQQLPKAAMVYQLPYRRFPESPPLFGSSDYDLLRPYLQTKSLRWSYGGMKGRETDWQVKLTNLPADELTRDVVAAGYQAYVIDRAGYEDHGAQIETGISAATGRKLMESTDGRWSFFDLTDLQDRFGTPAELTALKDELLNWPRVNLRGCSGTEGAGTDQFNWCAKSGSIEVIDPTPDSGNVLRASVIAPAGAGTLTLTVAGTKTDLAIGPGPTPIELTVPPGRDVVIQFKTDVPAMAAPGDSRDLRFRLVFPQVSPGP